MEFGAGPQLRLAILVKRVGGQIADAERISRLELPDAILSVRSRFALRSMPGSDFLAGSLYPFLRLIEDPPQPDARALADLLVKLYELPDAESGRQQLGADVPPVRPAMAYEKHPVVAWVQESFGPGWASECDVAFANRPISCHIATQAGAILGFACYDSACRGFFGPIGVADPARGRGVGRALLLSCLRAMAARGYAYAIVGGVDSAEFYRRTVGAIEIPGSTPGVYRDRLRKPVS